MALTIERAEALLLIAIVVAIVGRRFHLPYTVGLMLAGIATAFAPWSVDLHLTRQLIFDLFLPPLIFEAAFLLPWADLRRELSVLLALSTLGVLISAAVTSVGLRLLAGWPWPPALLFGVLISATDPVSVIALFKDLGVAGRLRLLTEAESLFNDGTAAVLFVLALESMAGGTPSAGGMAGRFLSTVAGGLACGTAAAVAALFAARQTEDRLVEIALTNVVAYGSFLLAEQLHVSGVLSTLAAGLIVGNTGSLGALTAKGREAVELYWEFATFAVNSLIFLLIGVQFAHQRLGEAGSLILVGIGLALAGRAAAVYGTCALFFFSRRRVSGADQHLLVWSGLRGALALALVLGLPSEQPYRNAMVAMTYGVVAFSVAVQGLTMPALLRAFGAVRALR